MMKQIKVKNYLNEGDNIEVECSDFDDLEMVVKYGTFSNQSENALNLGLIQTDAVQIPIFESTCDPPPCDPPPIYHYSKLVLAVLRTWPSNELGLIYLPIS